MSQEKHHSWPLVATGIRKKFNGASGLVGAFIQELSEADRQFVLVFVQVWQLLAADIAILVDIFEAKRSTNNTTLLFHRRGPLPSTLDTAATAVKRVFICRGGTTANASGHPQGCCVVQPLLLCGRHQAVALRDAMRETGVNLTVVSSLQNPICIRLITPRCWTAHCRLIRIVLASILHCDLREMRHFSHHNTFVNVVDFLVLPPDCDASAFVPTVASTTTTAIYAPELPPPHLLSRRKTPAQGPGPSRWTRDALSADPKALSSPPSTPIATASDAAGGAGDGGFGCDCGRSASVRPPPAPTRTPSSALPDSSSLRMAAPNPNAEIEPPPQAHDPNPGGEEPQTRGASQIISVPAPITRSSVDAISLPASEPPAYFDRDHFSEKVYRKLLWRLRRFYAFLFVFCLPVVIILTVLGFSKIAGGISKMYPAAILAPMVAGGTFLTLYFMYRARILRLGAAKQMGLLADTPMEQLMDVIQNMRPLPSAPIYDPNAPRFDDPLPVYATDVEEQNPDLGPDRPATPTLRDRIAAIMHSSTSPQLRRPIFRTRSALSMAGSEAPASSADPVRAAPSSFTAPSSTVIPSTYEPSSGASTPVGRGSASHIFLAPFVLAATARAASANSRASSRLGGGADSDLAPVPQRNSLLAVAAESALPAVGEEADHASVPSSVSSLPNSRGSTLAPFSPIGTRPASPTPTSFAGLPTNTSVANSVTGSAAAAATAATSVYESTTSLPNQLSHGVTAADVSPSPGPTPPPSSASPAASMAQRSTRRPSSSARALRRHAAAAAVAPRTRAVAVASVGAPTNPIDRLLLRTRGPVVFEEARLSDREYEVAARAQRRAARLQNAMLENARRARRQRRTADSAIATAAAAAIALDPAAGAAEPRVSS
ncbi:hypothetical protein HK405_002878, partial [Cladochytrium tenue]